MPRKAIEPRKAIWLKDAGWQALLLAGLVLIGLQTLLLGGAAADVALTFTPLVCLWTAAVAVVMPPPVKALISPRLMIAGAAAVLLVFWVIASLSGLKSLATLDKAATLRELFKLGGMACVFLAGLAIGARRTQARFFLHVLAVLAAIYALWAIVTFILDPGTLLGAPKHYHFDRLTASFASANTAASLFGGMTALAAVLAVEEGASQFRRTPTFGESRIQGPSPSLMVWAFTTLLCLAALMLTGSRFAMVATAVGLAAGVGLIAILAGMRVWIAMIVGGLALALSISLPVLVSARAASRAWDLGETTQNRLDAISSLAGMVLHRPVGGYGLGTFREAIAPQMTRDNLYLLWDLGAAHDLPVQWALETGLVGAVLAGVVLTALMSFTWPFPLKRSRLGLGRTIAVLAFSLVVLTHNLVDYSLQIPAIATLFAVLLGLAAGCAFQGDQKSEAA